MQKQQFVDIIKQPSCIESVHLSELELLVNEYPFFQTAHLLYTKGLHKFQSVNYSKQLRKTAIVANSRSVLYELIHKVEAVITTQAQIKTDVITEVIQAPIEVVEATVTKSTEQDVKKDINPVSITNNDIKVVYINTVITPPVIEPKAIETNSVETKPLVEPNQVSDQEIDIVKSIENVTEAPIQEFNEEKLNKSIEQEISKGIIQSYIETDILKTPKLDKEEVKEPSSFSDWLKTIQKESHQISPTSEKKPSNEIIEPPINAEKVKKVEENNAKPSFFSQNKQIIDKIIESDPGRIKLGSNKFFTPATDAKQSLLENEHLVTETLAKIYALQGNISKAIRSYEILSLKFPQKSVYFASLIEKLKTNK